MQTKLFKVNDLIEASTFDGLSVWELNGWYVYYLPRSGKKIKKIIEAVKMLPHDQKIIFKQLKPNVIL
jgi:hypothetical protein